MAIQIPGINILQIYITFLTTENKNKFVLRDRYQRLTVQAFINFLAPELFFKF